MRIFHIQAVRATFSGLPHLSLQTGFHVHRQVEQDKGQAKKVLVRRGSEW
jgi:hypothetical protein